MALGGCWCKKGNINKNKQWNDRRITEENNNLFCKLKLFI